MESNFAKFNAHQSYPLYGMAEEARLVTDCMPTRPTESAKTINCIIMMCNNAHSTKNRYQRPLMVWYLNTYQVTEVPMQCKLADHIIQYGG